MVKVRLFNPTDTNGIEDYIKEHPDIKVRMQSDDPYVDLSELGTNPLPPTEGKTPVALVKVGNEFFMKKLLEDGDVFMRTLEYYRKLENDGADCSDGRGDAYEGVDAITQATSIIVGDVEVPVSFTIRHNFPQGHRGLIYCLYGVYNDAYSNGKLILPDEMKAMGDSAVVITDPMAFIDRCVTAARKAGAGRTAAGSVGYYNETQGDFFLSPFFKRQKFVNQSEYRFYIPCNNKDDFTLKIGSIEDIADIFPISTFLNH